MRDEPFFDSNIVVYAFVENDPRSQPASSLITAGGIISVQVLNEFVNVGRRKLRWFWEEIDRGLAVLSRFLQPPIPLTVEMHERAIALARRHGFAFYDSLILAAALQAGCRVVYSEDMQHGRRIDSLEIRNPFVNG